MFSVQVFSRATSPFPSVFSVLLENFPPFSSNLKLLSANSFSLEESKICHGERYNASQSFTPWVLILTHQQQTAYENIVGKEEIASNEQFLLFPQCFLLNQVIVSHICPYF